MPRPETVKKALAEISKSTANYRYFFQNLRSPSWLAPLAEQGSFTNPPEKQEVEGGFIFPGWPASEYLCRMSKDPQAQDRVLTIVLGMRETDNIHVNSDLADIALALPAKSAAKLIKRAKAWVQTAYHNRVSSK